jgi:leucine-rich repeat protein SHOC2
MGNSLAKELEKHKKKEVIDLRNRGITELPTNLGILKCREFICAQNEISTIPDEIGQMAELNILDASANKINGLPMEIGMIKTLKELNLANNKLFFSPLTPELGKLKGLLKLDLSGNQLDELPLELANLGNLEYLNVSNNALKTVPVEFGILRSFCRLTIFS